jgi:endonuclease/exonuclease/phosphatase family metal-dependent hydrolase
MIATIRRACVLGVVSCVLSAAFVTAADAATAPPPTTGLVARTGTASAVLGWSPAKYATSYRVCLMEYKTEAPCVRLSGQTAATSLTLTGLKPTSGTDYFFKVYAYRGESRSVSAPKGFDLVVPTTPGTPTGITQRLSYTSLTISWSAAANARSYSVCLMTTPTTETCLRTSPRSATRSVTFTALRPTAGGDFYYRVYAYNYSASSRSAKHRVDLPVGAISSVTATKGAAGTIDASWAAATNAGTYELQIANDSAMSTSLKTYTVTGTSVAPSGLTIGMSYAYRVRGLNGVRSGPYTPVRLLRLPSNPAKVNVLTYNLCGQDKCVTSSNGMKRWTIRKDYAGAIARGTGSGIIATQESHDEATRFGTELPGFGLAAYIHAKSLFYNKAKYDVLRSGTITLSSTERKYAVWAEFRDKVARTLFIVVDAHLQPYKGKTRDDMRLAQTKILLSRVAAANPKDLPVIYAGDYNSNKNNADQSRYPGGYDAPLKVFTSAGIPDAFVTADTLVAPSWNSGNQATNPPIKHGDHIDHIYVDPEISVQSWRVILSLNGSNYATPFASDHNPIRALLTVPGR